MITKQNTLPELVRLLHLDVPVYRYHLGDDGTLTLWLYGRTLPLTVATGNGTPAPAEPEQDAPKPAPKRKPRKEATHD